MSTQLRNTVSLKDTYELVERVRRELSESITRLEGKFDALELGRVSALEKHVATLWGKMAIIGATAGAVTAALINWLM